jgi:Fe-S cluster assembly protein SufD
MNADIRQMKTAAELGLAQAFEAAREKLPGGAGIAARRSAAFRAFEDRGLPHRRVEEWKYTDLRALMRDAKPLAPVPDAQVLDRAGRGGGLVLPATEARRLTFVNGVLAPKLSDLAALEPGLSIVSLAKALGNGDPFVTERLGTAVPTDDVAVALNTAFMGDGAVIRVARDAMIARPIHLAFIFAAEAPAAVFARSLVVVEDGARLSLIETHQGPDGVEYQVNAALDLLVGDHARVDHVKVGTEGSRCTSPP